MASVLRDLPKTCAIVGHVLLVIISDGLLTSTYLNENLMKTMTFIQG